MFANPLFSSRRESLRHAVRVLIVALGAVFVLLPIVSRLKARGRAKPVDFQDWD